MELFNGRMIIGSVFGGFKGKSQLPHFAKECMKGVGYSKYPLNFHVLVSVWLSAFKTCSLKNCRAKQTVTMIVPISKQSTSHLCHWGYFQVVNLNEFITHELPFEKINEAFQLLMDGESLRCILHL